MEPRVYALTHPQQNIFAREITAPGTDVNNLFFVIKIDTQIDVDVMRQAIDWFIRNNDAVRTRIRKDGDAVAQVIAPYTPFAAAFVDLSEVQTPQREQTYRSWGQKPFDFYGGPLFDFKIVKIAPDRFGLYCNFHHIWCDGWATGLIWSGILTAYTSLVHGECLDERPSGIEPLLRGGEYTAADEAFWSDYLRQLELSDSRLTKAQQEDHAANRTVFEIDAALSGSIKAYCEKYRVKPYVFFSAVMAASRYRTHPAEDMVIGTLRMNRDDQAQRQTVGMCVMDAPVRIKPSYDKTFAQLTDEIAANAKEAAGHKKYPLSKVVEQIRDEQKIQRDILDFTLSFQKTKIETGAYPLPVRVWFGYPSVLSDSLILHVLDLFDGSFTVFYDYRTNLYSQQTISFLHGSVLRIISQVLARPETSLRALSILCEEEESLLRGFETAPGDFASPLKNVVELFYEQSRQSPDKRAIVAQDRTLTYRALDEASNRVANYLVLQGVGADDIVAISLSRDSKTLVCMLGILKAGGAFCCVDPHFPKDRIDYILKDSRAKTIIDENIYAQAESQSDTAPAVRIGMNDLCYAIYTSGTTGNPKGVLVEHKCLAANVRPDCSEMVAALAQTGRNTLAITSFSFDVSVIEYFYSLTNGIATVLATREEIESIDLLAEKMIKNDVNAVITTPSRMTIYLADRHFAQAMRNVDFVMVAGEAFIPGLYDKIKSISPGCRIFNCYGPSETFVTTSQEAFSGQVNLGAGIRGYRLYVLDQNRQRLPFGACGELCIGGVGISRGYQNLEEETKKKYILFESQRLYRSGDLAKFNEKGELVYFGRMDTQVKLRGFRVELQEIEQTIAKYQGIASCAVIVKKTRDNEFLAAFYTAGQNADHAALRSFLQSKLPYYMVPSAFVRLERLPTTLSGKSDARALQAMEVSFSKKGKPPVTEEQKKLCGLFASILKTTDIGIDDNFFELGGNSLSAASFIIEANAAGFAFAFADIFKKPTVELLCGDETAADAPIHADYSVLEPVLRWNDAPVRKRAFRSVLITGATGFLGLHVLWELLENTDCTVTCLIRQKGKLTPEKRLTGLLFYYFSQSFSALFGKRLFVVTGDMTRPGIFDQPTAPPELIINCAADVSHFTYGDGMYQINVGGVKNLIDYARENACKLIHISTPGVGMFGIEGQTEKKPYLEETDFYFGQDLSNAYVATKFMAEREILFAAAGGLDASIMRVGNLQGRYSDGEFQINQHSNAFQNTIKVYKSLQRVGKSAYESEVDYTPVDLTAKAICTLAMSDARHPVFHVFNEHTVTNALIFACLGELGYPIPVVSDDEYRAFIAQVLDDPEKRRVLTDIADTLTRETEGHFEIPYICRKTVSLLTELGFSWPVVTKEYILRCLKAVEELGLFD